MGQAWRMRYSLARSHTRARLEPRSVLRNGLPAVVPRWSSLPNFVREDLDHRDDRHDERAESDGAQVITHDPEEMGEDGEGGLVVVVLLHVRL